MIVTLLRGGAVLENRALYIIRGFLEGHGSTLVDFRPMSEEDKKEWVTNFSCTSRLHISHVMIGAENVPFFSCRRCSLARGRRNSHSDRGR